jgi:DNA-binding transcriptional MerR regulator
MGIHPRTLREWSVRGFPVKVERTDGGHRRFDRRWALACKDALDEGLSGFSACMRANELLVTGRYEEPRRLHDRMTKLETEVKILREEVCVRLEDLVGAVSRSNGRYS